jgi:hypothetical protein
MGLPKWYWTGLLCTAYVANDADADVSVFGP